MTILSNRPASTSNQSARKEPTVTTTITASAPSIDRLDRLRSRLAGELVTPDSGAEYDEARRVPVISTPFRHPEAIVRAVRPNDVVEAVRFAGAHGRSVAVRSGGHSVAGLNMIDDALVVDFSRMRRVSVDPARGTARVAPGANSRDVTAAGHAYGLALSTGDTATVGIGGLTIGGGVGFMLRKHGLTIDNLLSADVVTADGELVTASADENADLFWAIRGGGGNFGIITDFEFRMAKVGQVLGGALVLPASREVLRGLPRLRRGCARRPHHAREPHARPTRALHSGAPRRRTGVDDPRRSGPATSKRARRRSRRYVRWPSPSPTSSRRCRTPRSTTSPRPRSSPSAPRSARCSRTTTVPTLSTPFSMRCPSRLDRRASCSSAAWAAPLPASRPGPPPTPTASGASSRRSSACGTTLRTTRRRHWAWTNNLWEKIRGDAAGVYVNFLGVEGEERIREAYPARTYERLVEVKQKYDPQNMFCFNQNIRPRA